MVEQIHRHTGGVYGVRGDADGSALAVRSHGRELEEKGPFVRAAGCSKESSRRTDGVHGE